MNGSSSSSVPDPTPGEGELLIAPSAVGICGTDVEIFEGSLAYFRMGIASYPIVPGHEWAGEVVDVGRGVTGFSPGDRVVGEVAIGCGVCVRCRAGRQHLCARRTETGIVHMDGAMASRLVFPAAFAHRVELPARAAGLVEPTSVALHAVRRGRVAGQTRARRRRRPDRLARRAVRARRGRRRGGRHRPPRGSPGPRRALGSRVAAAWRGAGGAPAAAGRDTRGPSARAAVAERTGSTSRSCAPAGPPRSPRRSPPSARAGTVVALGLSGAPTIPFDFDGLVVATST